MVSIGLNISRSVGQRYYLRVWRPTKAICCLSFTFYDELVQVYCVNLLFVHLPKKILTETQNIYLIPQPNANPKFEIANFDSFMANQILDICKTVDQSYRIGISKMYNFMSRNWKLWHYCRYYFLPWKIKVIGHSRTQALF